MNIITGSGVTGPAGNATVMTPEKKTILLVDDYPVLARILQNILIEHGYEVHAAFSGPECIEMLASFRPDLILLDIFMEPMDGMETLRRIREEPSTRDIPVIILTAKQPTPGDVDAYSGLIDDYIIKPVLSDYLIGILSGFFKRRGHCGEVRRMADRSDLEPGLINEYLGLSRDIYLLHRFFRHLHIPLSACDLLPSFEGDNELWLDRINQEILEKEKRFNELKNLLQSRNIST
jgi:Response regulator containing a CheY-like receiver domain and a GGDEF domain